MTDLTVVDRAHSRISPSSIERAINCPASVFLSGSAPRAAPGIDALLGTAAHRVFEKCLVEGLDTLELGGLRSVQVEGHDVEVDGAMLDTVQVAIDAVRKMLDGRPYEVEATLHLDFAEFYLGEPIWGHADVITTDAPRVVIDLKNGYGFVGADSLQLGTYLLMPIIVDNPALDGEGHAGTTVIIQPNAAGEPVRSHDWTWSDLRGLRDRIIDMLRSVKRQDMTYSAGPWCTWCPAAGMCPHLAALARDAALTKVIPTPELVATGEISAATLEEWLDLGEVLDHWVRKVNDVALDYLVHGGRLKNRKLVRKRTVRRWIDPSEEAVATSLKRLGISPYQEKLITPAEAERRLPPIRCNDIAGMTEKPPGDLTLARADDGREAIDVGATLRMALQSSVAAGYLAAAQQRQTATQKGEQS